MLSLLFIESLRDCDNRFCSNLIFSTFFLEIIGHECERMSNILTLEQASLILYGDIKSIINNPRPPSKIIIDPNPSPTPPQNNKRMWHKLSPATLIPHNRQIPQRIGHNRFQFKVGLDHQCEREACCFLGELGLEMVGLFLEVEL